MRCWTIIGATAGLLILWAATGCSHTGTLAGAVAGLAELAPPTASPTNAAPVAVATAPVPPAPAVPAAPVPAPYQPSIGTNWTYQLGPEQRLGPGRLPSVACDRLGQPHVAADGGTWLYLYHRIGGKWIDTSKNLAPAVKQFFNPRIEIDTQDVAWASGCQFGASANTPDVTGAGLIVQRRVATRPGKPQHSCRRIQGAWDQGNLALDPARPGECVWMSADGKWQRIGINGATIESGQMFAGKGGEKNAFAIAGNSLRHAAIGGYDAWSSSYRNANMDAPVTWATFAAYPTQNDDGCYVSVAADRGRPAKAYMVAAFGSGRGVCVNVWNGREMAFSPTRLLTVDVAGGSGLRRFSPQLAPAPGGGCFVLWTRDGAVYCRFVTQSGIDSTELRVGAGTCAAGACDGHGGMWIAYSQGGAMVARRVKIERRER